MKKNTVVLKNYLNNFGEFVAASVITPGQFVEITSEGKVQRLTTDGAAIPILAIEDNLQGKDIHDDYAIGDQVQVWFPQRGDEAYVLLTDGQNVAVGDALGSSGTGSVEKVTGESGSVATGALAQVVDAIDLSGSSATEIDDHVCVRIL